MDICSIILCAGKGSRMKSNIPKPFHKISGLRMIDWIINIHKSLNINDLVIVASEKEDYYDYSNFIKVVSQKPALGTGDAVRCALQNKSNFKGIFLICFGDTPFITQKTLKRLISSIKMGNNLALSGFTKSSKNPYGKIIFSKMNNPIKIKEDKSSLSSVSTCNGGIMAANSSFLIKNISKIPKDKKSGEFFLTHLVEIAFKNNSKIDFVEVTEEEVMGINSRKELAEAEFIVQQKLRKKFLNNGVTLIDPNNVYFSYDTKIEKDVTIHPSVVIGTNVKIKQDVEIFSFTHLIDCTINKNTNIGPFTRIRGNSNIGKKSKIGNFVEIKNGKFESNVKINHLSYIGDAAIKSNVNIGAGTITCNYDGFKKNNTIIGSDSFIGSNSTLIAPVKIGKLSTVAAGSVITNNVPSKSLAIGRKRQINKSDKSIKINNLD